MDDLSKLTDEELDQAIEAGSQLDQSPSEQEAEEEVVDQPEAESAEAPADEEPAEKEEVEEQGEESAPQPSRRENLRIQQLLEKLQKQPQAPAEHKAPTGIDYGATLDADPEVISQLESDRQQVAATSYNEGLEQAKSIQFHTRLEIDAPKVESKYKQLNPEDKENFNPALANAVNTWYLQTSGYDQQTGKVANPNIRYAEFVEGIMELGRVIGSQESVKAAKNVAKQAATTGLRPDGSTAKRLDLNKAPGAMSDEELDAFLAKQGVATKR
jgi:hypothetical protein